MSFVRVRGGKKAAQGVSHRTPPGGQLADRHGYRTYRADLVSFCCRVLTRDLGDTCWLTIVNIQLTEGVETQGSLLRRHGYFLISLDTASYRAFDCG